MMKIKEPAVANLFYSGEFEELSNQLNGFAVHNTNKYKYKTRAIIVPHAGLVYSGQLAFDAISQLDKDIKNIFIFAPSHKIAFEGLALSTYDVFRTPVGDIPVNQDINKELEEKFGAKFFDDAHNQEHAIEVQLPAIQSVFGNVKIIPIVIGQENPAKIANIISNYYQDKDYGFIISSDLSHYLSDDEAQKIDGDTANMIETGDVRKFTYEQACGALGICSLVEFANRNNFTLIRINMYNSSRVSIDKSRVVGYGAWFLYEGERNEFIKTNYSDYIINLCRDVIASHFDNRRIETKHPHVFNEQGACFVTLKKNGELRGCIGSIVAHRPLIFDLVEHAQNAAFRDPRFNPLSREELNEIKIDVSLLSEPVRIEFNGEEDLLNKIVPNKDGIIIRDGQYQAVYLPSVWEEIPDKVAFLQSLKMKAGLHPKHFTDTFEAFRFYTDYIEEQ